MKKSLLLGVERLKVSLGSSSFFSGIFTSECNISVTFSATKGMDQVKMSMKLGRM